MKDYVPEEEGATSEASSGDVDLGPGNDVEESVAVKEPERMERIPDIVTKIPGKVNRTLEGLAARYKALNPDRDCRWVYSPQHRPELSNVIARTAEGYKKVKTKELDMDLEDLESGDNVRVGDVILMGIPMEERKELIAERQQLADEQTRSTERSYYEETEDLFERHRTEGDESSGRPKGRSKTEVRTFEHDVEQREG